MARNRPDRTNKRGELVGRRKSKTVRTGALSLAKKPARQKIRRRVQKGKSVGKLLETKAGLVDRGQRRRVTQRLKTRANTKERLAETERRKKLRATTRRTALSRLRPSARGQIGSR